MAKYELEHNFKEVAGRVSNIMPVFLQHQEEMMTSIGETILGFVEEDYRDKSQGQTGGDGIEWAPLTLSAAVGRLRKRAEYNKLKRVPPVKGEKKKAREARVKNNKKIMQKKREMERQELASANILVDTGKMINALTPYHTEGDSKNVLTVDKLSVTVGLIRKGGKSGVDIASVHNFGSQHIPARQILGEESLQSQERQDEIVETIEEFIEVALKENGFK